MPDEPTAPGATRLNPGEKYRADATFDLTKKLSWVWIKDEETRRVQTTGSWAEPGTITNEQMLAAAVRFGAPDRRPIYLAEYQENEPGYRYLDYAGFYSFDPVNQVYYVREWEPHLCTMAHDVDQFNTNTAEFRRPDSWKKVPHGDHSAETQIRNQNTMQVFRAGIGDALRRLDRWANLAPEGTDSFSTDWQQQREGIRAHHRRQVVPSLRAQVQRSRVREAARLLRLAHHPRPSSGARRGNRISHHARTHHRPRCRTLDPARYGEPRVLRWETTWSRAGGRQSSGTTRAVHRYGPQVRPAIRGGLMWLPTPA